jgi:hypothetical protein
MQRLVSPAAGYSVISVQFGEARILLITTADTVSLKQSGANEKLPRELPRGSEPLWPTAASVLLPRIAHTPNFCSVRRVEITFVRSAGDNRLVIKKLVIYPPPTIISQTSKINSEPLKNSRAVIFHLHFAQGGFIINADICNMTEGIILKLKLPTQNVVIFLHQCIFFVQVFLTP